MSDPIAQLYDVLIRSGISPRATARYCAELCDHRDDLAEHLVGQGMTYEEAFVEAQSRLGGMDQLMMPMLVDRRNRSVAARWPLLCFAALPLMTQVLASILSVVVLGLVARWLWRAGFDLPDLASAISISWLMLPVLLGWLAMRAASLRGCPARWPLVGAGVGIALATALQLDVELPTDGIAGTISVVVGLPALLPAIVLMGLVLLPEILRGQIGAAP